MTGVVSTSQRSDFGTTWTEATCPACGETHGFIYRGARTNAFCKKSGKTEYIIFETAEDMREWFEEGE